MKPIEFKDQNCIMRGDHLKDGDGQPVGNLPCFRGTDGFVSCWRVPFWERIRLLFKGNVWLTIWNREHPPVSLQANNPFKQIRRSS